MMDSQEKITLIINWSEANKHKKFDTTHVYNLQEKLDMFGKLTPAQDRSLENIIVKWGMMGRNF